MSYYSVKAGWILLILTGHYRLPNGGIVCNDYRIVRMGETVPAEELRKSLLLNDQDEVQLYVCKDGETEVFRIKNRAGELVPGSLRAVA